uniref:Uncharacterized protein n=1 Tax=Anguilla anguilla TaxID=7936 RepID=A0A0E9TAR6_ANGAN
MTSPSCRDALKPTMLGSITSKGVVYILTIKGLSVSDFLAKNDFKFCVKGTLYTVFMA